MNIDGEDGKSSKVARDFKINISKNSLKLSFLLVKTGIFASNIVGYTGN